MAAAILFSAEEREEALIDEVVNTALNQIVARWPTQGQLLLPENIFFYHAPLGQKPAGLPPEILNFSLGNSEFFQQGREFHVGVREHQGERFYLLYDTQVHEARLESNYYAVLIGVVILSALGLLAGHFLAANLLRKLSALTRSVQQHEPIDLSAQQDVELMVLARAIHDAREQNMQLLQREREFTAHVSHELRTPLTRIRTTAELLQELNADLPIAFTERLQHIELAADEMQQRLHALLFLARELRATQLIRLNLRDEVAQSLSGFKGQKPQITRINSVDEDAWIDADPQLLRMLLDNLLSNALRYTQTGQIELFWQQGALRVRDTGQGMSQQALQRVRLPFERASHLADGFGLGLAIVNRICEAMDWPWLIESQLGEGTQIRVQIQAIP